MIEDTETSKEESVKRDVKDILPEKFKFLNQYETLKNHLIEDLYKFSGDEWSWFQETYEFVRKGKTRNVTFVETIPSVVSSEMCAGFLASIVQKQGLKVSDIATNMGVYRNAVHTVRQKLEKLKLIVVQPEPIEETTRCFLNDGQFHKNGYPPIPRIVNIVLKMMEKRHGQDDIIELISVNKNVQKNANKKHMKKIRAKK